MRGPQLVAAALSAALLVVAFASWRGAAAFRERARRAPATLVRIEEREVRSLFATETARYPVVRFEDAAGESHEFEARTEVGRLDLAADTAAGAILDVEVLYDPDRPALARLDAQGAARGPLLLVGAALLLLLTPAALARAFGRASGDDGA